jgi:hypothetical protein
MQSSMTVFLTLFSGFVAISYFAAHRLDRISMIVGLAFFVGFALFNLLGTGAALRSYSGLSHEMQSFAAAGRGLRWHNAGDAPLLVVDIMQPIIMVGGAVVIAAAIRIFFYYRRANRLAEARV